MTQTLQCQALLFDLDGTLIDSLVAANRSWRKWGQRAGLGDEFALHGKLHGLQRPEVIATVRPDLTQEEVSAEADYVQAMERDDIDGVEALPGSLPLLGSLPVDRWAIVTSADREVATARIAAAGLPQPRVLLTADEITQGKPDPAGYLKAAEMLGFTPEDCVVAEDAATGLQAAINGGMRCIGTRHSLTDEELAIADAIVDNLGKVSCEVTETGLVLHIS